MPPAQKIKVKNIGGGALGSPQAVVEPPVKWLELTPTQGGFTASLRPAGVVRGRHSTTVTVKIEGAEGSVSVVPITLDADESFPADTAGATDADGGVDAGPTTTSGTKGGGGCSLALAPRAAAPAAAVPAAAAVLFGLRRRRRSR
jgi:hypothetical protein